MKSPSVEGKREQWDVYKDIINLPHPVSETHPQMTSLERAAQFSPFAALTGLGAAVEETARRTEDRAELDEDRKEQLDQKLRELLARLKEQPLIAVEYFEKDARKQGGAYRKITGALQKIDIDRKYLILTGGTEIAFEDIYNIS